MSPLKTMASTISVKKSPVPTMKSTMRLASGWPGRMSRSSAHTMSGKTSQEMAISLYSPNKTTATKINSAPKINSRTGRSLWSDETGVSASQLRVSHSIQETIRNRNSPQWTK